MIRPTNRELEDAIKEEMEAMQEYARLNETSTTIELQKRAARVRLLNARSAKAALFNDLMSV